MAQRLFDLSNTLGGVAGTLAGVPISAALYTVGDGVPGIDGAGVTILDSDITTDHTTTDANGNWTLTGLRYPGDYASPATVGLLINEGGQITLISGFAYASSISMSSLYPTPGAANATLTMLVDLGMVDQSALSGSIARFSISQLATAPNGQVYVPGQVTNVTSDVGGFISMPLVPTASLSPGGSAYSVAFDDGTVWWFTVPSTPTGLIGAYAGGTAYVTGNIVSSGGVYYQAIASTTGHAPPNVTYWKLWAGEPIYDPNLSIDHRTQVASNGAIIWTLQNIAHSSSVPPLADDPVQSPASAADDLANLAARVPGARRSISTSAAINAVTDDNVFASASGGAIAPTLPLASARTRKYYIIKTDNTASVTITATGGNTINGASTLALSTQYQWAVLESDGSNWYAQTGTGGGGGASTFSFATFTANHTIVTSDSGLAGDGASAAVQFTLPTAVGATQLYAVKAVNSLAHAVTVVPQGGQTVEGVTVLTLATLGQVIVFASDGANWRAESGYAPSPFTGKGDLAVGLAGGAVTRLAVGADTMALLADSTQTTGLRWGTVSGGGGGGSGAGELLVQDGVTSPPVALTLEDGTDFLYQG